MRKIDETIDEKIDENESRIPSRTGILFETVDEIFFP